MMIQLQSFFNTVFRYTCLFHNKFLLKYSISPSVSHKFKRFEFRITSHSLNYFQNAAKLTIALNILLPLMSSGIFFTQNSPGLSICLGEGYKNFFPAQLEICNYNDPIGNYACKLFFILQVILTSNLIDIYCIYFISKTINSKTEAAKTIIGKNNYISRKKYVYHTYFHFLFHTDQKSWMVSILGKFRFCILC